MALEFIWILELAFGLWKHQLLGLESHSVIEQIRKTRKMGIVERVPGGGPPDVKQFPSSEAPCWRLWMLEFSRTANRWMWVNRMCCEKLSELLMGAVLNGFMEAKVSVEVELEEPSVSDIDCQLNCESDWSFSD